MNLRLLLFNTLLAALLLIAPLYYQSNLGGTGLELTYNIPAWAAAVYTIGSGFIFFAFSRTIVLPKNAWAFLVFPVVMILSGLLAGSSQPIPWLFRQIYVLGGILFFFSLFQFKLRPSRIEKSLYIIAISSLLNALVALIQILAPDLLRGLFPSSGHLPIGIFQQVNVLASFLSTGLVVSLYLISRPSIRCTHPAIKALLIINIGLCSFIIVYTGSRVGFLSGILGITFLGLSRWRFFRKQTILTALVLAAIIGGSIQGHHGFARVVNKTSEITQGTSASARINMYAIALELVAEEPIHGHGIGNFLRVWGLQTGDYHQRHPHAALPPYVTHPHNELVYWLIEGGVIAFFGILISIGAILLALLRCGPQRGWAYCALLLPISLHTLVELPFYISAIHWFLWLFLIFLVLRHHTTTRAIPLSMAATRLLKGSTIVFCVGVSYFLFHCAQAQQDIYNFIKAKNIKGPYLEIALNNLYSKSYAEQLAMRSLLHSGIQTGDAAKVRRYVDWGERYIAINPELKIFEDLINAYAMLKQEEKKCRTIAWGAYIYPEMPSLQKIARSCGQIPHAGNP